MHNYEHIESLFENATEGIILTNSSGIIVLVNPSAKKMFGYTSEEIIGKPVEILIPDKQKLHHHELREGYYQSPGNRSMGIGRDLNGRKKGGADFPVEVSLSHYKKNNELFVIAFLVDITERKKIELNLIKKQNELEKVTNDIRKLNTELEMKVDERTHILKEALQRLEQSQNELSEALDKERQLNEIKSRFVSMASHEFRTPLSAVLSSASLISKYTKEDEQEKRERHIVRIKESIKHLNDILEDFLSLGRLDEGGIAADPSEFNINDTITDILSDFKLLLKRDQYFNFYFEGSDNCYADKKLLRNILINVISNAIKFSEEGSSIDISISVCENQVVISIVDHGIGVSKEDQKHLFSSFFRGSNAINIQGTGLGLHIVKRYTDLMNGTVHLQSELDKGTTITITFPCSQT